MSLKGIGKFIRGRSKSEGREPSDYALRDLETVTQAKSVGPLGNIGPVVDRVDQELGAFYAPTAPPSDAFVPSTSSSDEEDDFSPLKNKKVKGKDVSKLLQNLLVDVLEPQIRAVKESVKQNEGQVKQLQLAANRFSIMRTREGAIDPPDTVPDSSTVGGLDRSTKLSRLFQSLPTFKPSDGNVREFLLALKSKVHNVSSFLKISDNELKAIILDKLDPAVCKVINGYEPTLTVKDIFHRLSTHFDDSETAGEAQRKLCVLTPSKEISNFSQFRAEAGRLASLCANCDPQLYLVGLMNFLPQDIIRNLKDNILHFQAVNGKNSHPSIEELLQFVAPYRLEIDTHLDSLLKSQRKFRTVQAGEVQDLFVETANRQMDSLEQTRDRLKALQASILKDSKEKKQDKGRGNIACSNCNKTTHKSENCWKLAICPMCGKRGHIARQCRAPRCDLCGGRSHTASSCVLYDSTNRSSTPCNHCMTLHGATLMHPSDKCLMRDLVEHSSKN